MTRYRGQMSVFQYRGPTEDPKDGIHRSNIDETRRVIARQGVYSRTTSSASLFDDTSDVIWLTTRRRYIYNQI